MSQIVWTGAKMDQDGTKGGLLSQDYPRMVAHVLAGEPEKAKPPSTRHVVAPPRQPRSQPQKHCRLCGAWHDARGLVCKRCTWKIRRPSRFRGPSIQIARKGA